MPKTALRAGVLTLLLLPLLLVAGPPADEHLREARGLARAGRYPEALAAYDRAAAAEPWRPAIALEAAGLALASGDYPAAARAYERAATLNPSSGNAWLGLARARAGGDDLDGAAAAYARATETLPDPRLALVAGDLLLAADDPGAAEVYARGEAQALARGDQPALAEARLRLAIQAWLADSGRAWVYVEEGLASAPPFSAARLRVLQAAMEEGRVAERKLPALGQTCLRLGFPELAERTLRACTRNHPQSADAQAYHALALLASGRVAEALDVSAEALGLRPDHALARYVRAAATRLGGDTRAALGDLRALVAAEPGDSTFLVELARAYADLGDYEAGARLLEEAVAADKNPETLLAATGFLLERAYQPATALAWAEQAAAALPDEPAAQRTLGWALHLAGRSAEAATALAKATTLDPLDAEAHYHLAVVRAKMGAGGEARETYWRAADLDPTGPVGRRARQALLDLQRRQPR